MHDSGQVHDGVTHDDRAPATDAAHEHPGDRTYINVAIILSVVTAIEVAVYYIEALSDLLVPILVVLSIFKFVMVVGFFMHLKFDDRRFTWIFLSGLIIAVAAVLALGAMFDYNPYDEFGL